MGLFDKLFGRKDAPSLSDSVFGHVAYDDGIWTHVPKRPEGGFMITVAAPQSGPSDAQRVFFAHVLQALPALEQQAKDFIGLKAEDDTDVERLSIYSLEIGTEVEVQSERFVMELSDADAIVIHRVSFESGTPIHYTHDD